MIIPYPTYMQHTGLGTQMHAHPKGEDKTSAQVRQESLMSKLGEDASNNSYMLGNIRTLPDLILTAV
jgi:hypothetical protein